MIIFLDSIFFLKKRREWVKEREREKQELEEILRLGEHQHFNPPHQLIKFLDNLNE